MCQSKMMRIYKRRSQSPRKAVGLLKPGPHVVRVAQRGQWPRSSVLLRFCSHENRSKFIDIGSLYTPDIHMCYCLTLYCTHYFIARRQIRCYRTVTLCNIVQLSFFDSKMDVDERLHGSCCGEKTGGSGE